MMKVSMERILKYSDCCKDGALNFKKALGNREVFGHQLVGSPIPLEHCVWFLSKELPLDAFVDIAAECAMLTVVKQKVFTGNNEIADIVSDITAKRTVDIQGSTVHKEIYKWLYKNKTNKSLDWYALSTVNHYIVANHKLLSHTGSSKENLRKRLYDDVVAAVCFAEMFPDVRPKLIEYIKNLAITYPNKE